MKTFQRFCEEISQARQTSSAMTQQRLEQQKSSALERQQENQQKQEELAAKNREEQRQRRIDSLESQIEQIRKSKQQ